MKMSARRWAGLGVFAFLVACVAITAMAATSVPGDLLYKGRVWFAGPVTFENSQAVRVESGSTLTVVGTGALVADGSGISGITVTYTNVAGIVLTNAANAGAASIEFNADKNDDAGDKMKLLVADGSGGLNIQSDLASKGTLATVLTISGAGGIAAADAITLTDADTNATLTVKGFESSYADLVLDADQGDDNEDTWTIRSDVDNDLSFINHETERLKVTAAGAVSLAGTLASDDLDANTATTLLIGKSTATKVEIADTAVETEVQGTLDVHEAAGFVGSVTLGAAAKFITTPVANAAATNEQVLTLAGVVNLFTASGQDNAFTNTVTLANPTAAGQWAIIYNAAAATNLLAIAKTGNFDGPALELAGGESAIIFAPSSTKWAGIGQ